MAFGALSRHFDIAAVAVALQDAKDTRLLADPSVAVLENEQAVFKSVQEIPIQQLTQTAQAGQIGTTAFREAGIKLTVTPKIAADGIIRMSVSPEFSRFVGTDSNGQPIIDTRFAETVLSAANRQTIVIAGLRQREDIGEFSGVPYLKDIRGVGKLFRSRDTRVRESELVVFISAEIISPADPLNHREAQIVDTVGCRLNQVTEAEGCPPPCDSSPAMPPLRLPEPELDYAEELPPLAGVAVPIAVPGDPSSIVGEPATRHPARPCAGCPPPPRPEPDAIHHRGVAVAPRAASRTARLAGPGISTTQFARGSSAPPVRRLPTVDREVLQAATDSPPTDLFGAPPPPSDSALRTDYDSRYRSGGALQFGSPSVSGRSPQSTRLR
jgi:hypothetical protein